MVSLVPVKGPTDLPELRQWLLNQTHHNGLLGTYDTHFVHGALAAAQLWWVEEETCHLLAESAPTWPDDATLDLHDIPTPAGLAIFAHDIVGRDAVNPDMPLRVSGIVWGPITLPPLDVPNAKVPGLVHEFLEGTGRTGLGIGIFSRLDLHKGLDHDDLMRSLESLVALDTLSANVEFVDKTGKGELHSHDQIKQVTFQEGGHEATLYCYMGRTDWLDGWAAGTPIPDSPSAGNAGALASMAEDRKLIASLFALTNTSVVTVAHHRPPRHVARRSERKGLSADVQVLRLGGSHQENVGWSAPGSKRDWKHSWIVRPHWRWQAHGPGWTERKLILVGPYKKGPADAPLIGANRVWRVVPPGGGGND